MRKQFKDTALELAAQDEKVVLVFGDISVYLFNEFKERYPERFFNMGICENTLISVGAGLSHQGFFPFVHSIAPFVTDRCVEQIKVDMCYNRFGGNLVSCGASFDYAWDGATHHSYMELAIFRMLPGMEVMQPGSKKEVDSLLKSQYNNGKSSYMRLSDNPHGEDLPVEFGKGVILKDSGSSITVMTAGPLLKNVLPVCRELPVNLVYFHTLKPIDQEIIARFKDTHILVFHDAFGLKEAISEIPRLSITHYGLPDAFCVWYGTVHDIRREIGLDSASIQAKIQRHLNEL